MYKGSAAAGNMVNKGTSVARKESVRGSVMQDEAAKGSGARPGQTLQAMLACFKNNLSSEEQREATEGLYMEGGEIAVCLWKRSL